MGEAAPKEPSMEDILASIRKIVSQDEPAPERRPAAPGAHAGPSGRPPSQPSPASPSSAPPSPASRSTLAELAGGMTGHTPRPQSGQGLPARAGGEAAPSAAPSAARAAPAAQPASSPAARAAAAPPSSAQTGEAASARRQSFAGLAHELTASLRQSHATADQPAARPQDDRAAPSARMAGGGWPGASMAGAPASANTRASTGTSTGTSTGARSEAGAGTGGQGHAAAGEKLSAPVTGHGQAVPPPSPAPARAAPASPPPAPAKRAATEDREVEAFRGALMSPGTEAAVSDSLDRLKRGVANDLDAKVEAVLRPMLREWLDDNLPGLVERLVRAEIERLARK